MGRTRRSVLAGVGLVTAGTGLEVLGRSGLSSGRSQPTAGALVAGSLLELANRIAGASVEAHGSVAVRQLVLNELRVPDAVALADPRLFTGIADRVTLFATNALVLAYDPGSPHADAIEADWQAALAEPGCRLGRTDPGKDPLGYRTVMALRLADQRYGLPAEAALERSSVFLETDLLNVVEGGTLDAAFVYRNMAVQRGLPYVELPEAIDFSSPDHEPTYRSVAVDVGGEPVRGSTIRYAAAALSAAGEPWIDDLVTAGTTLREAGFAVPADYPIRETSVSAVG